MAENWSKGWNRTFNTFNPYGSGLIKSCAEYPITSYGSYSGLFGISTDGGNVVVPWDITVTPAPRACS